MYTAPTNRDFYLTSLFIAYEKDVNCDCTSIYILTATKSGANVNLLLLPTLTLTASRNSASIYFNKPLLINRGANIVLTGAFTVGAMAKSGMITGFTV